MDTETREKLILRNRKLVEQIVGSIIKKFGIPYNLEKDDLISIGTIAMIEAIDSYDNRKGELEKWVSTNIFGRVMDSIRENKSIVSTEIHFDPDRIGNRESPYLVEELNNLVDELTEEEYEIFKLYFIKGITQIEISNLLNIKLRTIERRIQNIKDKIEDTIL